MQWDVYTGNEPKEMFEKLSQYGALGQHMIDVTKNEPWAQYLRKENTRKRTSGHVRSLA
jgi:hypothetical protein